MQRHLTALCALLFLGACSSPPRPPNVDESSRRPANTRTAVDLQLCRGELQGSRIAASETQRIAETTLANASRLVATAEAARHAAQQAAKNAAATPPLPRNAVYVVRFSYGSTRVAIPDSDGASLVAAAKDAALVVLRGRTDAITETPSEARVARLRTAAVKEFLEARGTDPARIRVTWQAAGDHATDNSTPEGRAVNRRVEIEIYRAAPQAAVAIAPADSPVGDRQTTTATSREEQHGTHRR